MQAELRLHRVAHTLWGRSRVMIIPQAAYAEENARRKALEVFERLSALAPPSGQAGAGDRDRVPDFIIASDSVVEAEGRIMEKPADASEATAMLKMLSGSVHRVHSGVCIIVTGPESSTMKPPPSPSSTGTLTATTLAGSSVTIRTFAESTEVSLCASSCIDRCGCTLITRYSRIIHGPHSSLSLKFRRALTTV